MSSYIGINNLARRIKKIFIGEETYYTPLEYMQSNGHQYINTLVRARGSVEFEIRFENLTDTSSGSACILGGRNGDKVNDFQLTTYKGPNNDRAGTIRWGTDNYEIETQVIGNSPRIITFKNDKVTNSATSQDETFLVDTTLESVRCFTIFGLNNGGLFNNASMRLYYLKLWNNGNLVRHFIPVKDQNNVVCLYEQVEGKFYYNQGIESFTASQTEGSRVSLGSRARQIKNGYIGVNNIAQKCFTACNPLPSTATGLFHFDNHVVNALPFGTITEGTFYTNVNGKFDSCCRVGNNSQIVSTLYNLGYVGSQLSSNNLTLCWWQKYNGSPNYTSKTISCPFNCDYNTSGSSQFIFDSTSNYVRPNSYFANTSSNALVPWGYTGVNNGEWHFICLVFYDNGTYRMFIDGMISSYGTTKANSTFNFNKIKWGASNQSYWSDEFMICKEALYTEEFIPPTLPWG